VVYLKDGTEVRGAAQISEDGQTLSVTVTKDGQEQALTFPYADVSKIDWAAERKADLEERLRSFKDPLSTTIEKLIEELTSGDQEVAATAKGKLLGMGIFAVDYLSERLADLEGAAASQVGMILRINEMKSFISPDVVKLLKRDFYEELVSATREEKTALLRELMLLEEDGAVPLLMHVAKDKQQESEVRNFCLHALARGEHNKELLSLMSEDDGWLKLAAALYLADNGIYAGAPYFISALKMRDPGMRQVAAEKLRQASGSNMGFDPDGTPEEREAAIGKWEKWWEEHNAEVLMQSAKLLSSDEIPDDDRSFSIVYQKRAHTLWDGGKPEEALESFRKAIELDPSNLNARLSAAILLYSELGRSDEARAELKLVLKRYEDEASPMIREYAFYHLALMDLSSLNWKDAIHNLNAAIVLDGGFTDGYIALGKALYIQAVRDETISRGALYHMPEGERREYEELRSRVISDSILAFQTALSQLDTDIRNYMNPEFRTKRREAEREIIQRTGTDAGEPTQVEWERAFRTVIFAKKARVCSMLADSYALKTEPEGEQRERKWRMVVNCLRDAVNAAPEEPEYLCKLGSALAIAGNLSEARDAFERCLKLDPGNETASQGLKDLK
jgi:tetratricopeptide (TPR) repeat protein